LLERAPSLLYGHRGSRLLIPGRGRYRLERLLASSVYRRLPPPRLQLRGVAAQAKLLFAGDLALHRWPETATPERVFGAVRPTFADADYRVVNLETVLTAREQPSGRIGTLLKAPPAALECLRYLGVHAASSANNHALDFGSAGLADCGLALSAAGIDWFGIEQDTGAAEPVPGSLVREVNGITIGMLAATDHFGGAPDAGYPRPVWTDTNRLRQSVRRLRSYCDVVVLQLHWGYEYVMYPLRWHRDLARQLVDDGADLVLCHHAHVVMGVESRGRGVIAHGLGNFYFGPRSRSPRHPLWWHGILLQASVDRHGLVACEVIPVRTDDSSAVQREQLGCPGYHRLCARLSAERLLARSEKAVHARALAEIALDLQGRIARADLAGLRERQAFLTAPRHDWLLARAVQSPVPAHRAMGEWLTIFRSLPATAVERLELPPQPQLGDLAAWLDDRMQPDAAELAGDQAAGTAGEASSRRTVSVAGNSTKHASCKRTTRLAASGTRDGAIRRRSLPFRAALRVAADGPLGVEVKGTAHLVEDSSSGAYTSALARPMRWRSPPESDLARRARHPRPPAIPFTNSSAPARRGRATPARQ
jgi:poly-gamma-glutamate synthesis protein (capsule biosynthesis protein)